MTDMKFRKKQKTQPSYYDSYDSYYEEDGLAYASPFYVTGYPDDVKKTIVSIEGLYHSSWVANLVLENLAVALLKPRIKTLPQQFGLKQANLIQGCQLVLRGTLESIKKSQNGIGDILKQYSQIIVPLPTPHIAKILIGPGGATLKATQAELPAVTLFLDLKGLQLTITGKTKEAEDAVTFIKAKMLQIGEEEELKRIEREKEKSKGFFGKGGKPVITSKVRGGPTPARGGGSAPARGGPTPRGAGKRSGS